MKWILYWYFVKNNIKEVGFYNLLIIKNVVVYVFKKMNNKNVN